MRNLLASEAKSFEGRMAGGDKCPQAGLSPAKGVHFGALTDWVSPVRDVRCPQCIVQMEPQLRKALFDGMGKVGRTAVMTR